MSPVASLIGLKLASAGEFKGALLEDSRTDAMCKGSSGEWYEWVAGLRQFITASGKRHLLATAIIQLIGVFMVFRGSRGRRTLTALDD